MTTQAITQTQSNFYNYSNLYNNYLYNNPYAFMLNNTSMSNDFFGSQINWTQGLGSQQTPVIRQGNYRQTNTQFNQPLLQFQSQQYQPLFKPINSIGNIDILKEPKKSNFNDLKYVGNYCSTGMKYQTSQTFENVYNLTKMLNENNQPNNYLG